MKFAAATLLALGLLAGAAQARPIDSYFADLSQTAPRAPFDQIQDTAPRSPFDQINDTAPRSYFDRLNDTAPRSADTDRGAQQDLAGE